MKDPDFLKDAQAGNFEVDPINGEQMQKIAQDLMSMPDAVKKRARPFVE
jgi:hypothetical protein